MSLPLVPSLQALLTFLQTWRAWLRDANSILSRVEMSWAVLCIWLPLCVSQGPGECRSEASHHSDFEWEPWEAPTRVETWEVIAVMNSEATTSMNNEASWGVENYDVQDSKEDQYIEFLMVSSNFCALRFALPLRCKPRPLSLWPGRWSPRSSLLWIWAWTPAAVRDITVLFHSDGSVWPTHPLIDHDFKAKKMKKRQWPSLLPRRTNPQDSLTKPAVQLCMLSHNMISPAGSCDQIWGRSEKVFTKPITATIATLRLFHWYNNLAVHALANRRWLCVGRDLDWQMCLRNPEREWHSSVGNCGNW